MGQFTPGIDKLARFNIEGTQGGVTIYSDDKKAPKDDTYYCQTRNKYMKVKGGGSVTLCCNRNMEPLN